MNIEHRSYSLLWSSELQMISSLWLGCLSCFPPLSLLSFLVTMDGRPWCFIQAEMVKWLPKGDSPSEWREKERGEKKKSMRVFFVCVREKSLDKNFFLIPSREKGRGCLCQKRRYARAVSKLVVSRRLHPPGQRMAEIKISGHWNVSLFDGKLPNDMLRVLIALVKIRLMVPSWH